MLSDELRRLRGRVNPDEGRVARALIEEIKAAEARALMLENQKRRAKARACITLEAGGKCDPVSRYRAPGFEHNRRNINMHRITIQKIVECTAEHFGLPVIDILSQRRQKELVNARTFGGSLNVWRDPKLTRCVVLEGEGREGVIMCDHRSG